MPMKPNKKRRKEFRAALRDAQLIRPDRFTEMMHAVANGGTRPCQSCGLIYPAATLDVRDLCDACGEAFSKLRERVPDLKPSVLEPGVVWTDASYMDGVAGLAVVGALGEHARAVEAKTSTQAEVLALRWAMEIARKGKVRDLTFRTDCQAAFKMFHWGKASMGWTVEQIPRRENFRADRLAGRARVAA